MNIDQTWLVTGSTIVALFMATTMIIIRAKSAQKPATVKKIILPPIMMSSGALMFIFPAFHVSLKELALALLIGVICSIFIIKTTKFKIEGQGIFLIPSKAFILVLVVLLMIRLAGKVYLGQQISFGETSGIFFLVAFGMIFTWRLMMLIKFLKLRNALSYNNKIKSSL